MNDNKGRRMDGIPALSCSCSVPSVHGTASGCTAVLTSIKLLLKVNEEFMSLKMTFSLQSAIDGQEDTLKATKYNFRPRAVIMASTLTHHRGPGSLLSSSGLSDPLSSSALLFTYLHCSALSQMRMYDSAQLHPVVVMYGHSQMVLLIRKFTLTACLLKK